ncbi:NAD-dependent epimerase/dehydratase family protein [Spongiactinospora sp. 9N601]|uniref:NAD-dependent epimerase/dehydratase family protein n=1 Tax=Spongiactinospora sp. 9N601 TaxID=3375149 RepID=UPI00379DBA27
MGKHVVVGAGQVGSELVRQLAGLGHEVVVVSRSGSGPDLPGVRRAAADAADQAALTALTRGADTLYNCVNPPYHRWPTDWPPIAGSLLGAAETTGADYVMLGNLYVYAPPTGPMTEDLPLRPESVKAQVRVRMWEQALAAHRAGRIRCTEVRGSDFFGPGALDQSHLGERFVPRLLAGKALKHIADPDQPHSWTYIPDVAAALAIAGTDERSWGRAWHIPTAPPMSYRQVAERMSELAGVAMPKVGSYPAWMIDALGLANPMLGEIKHIRYQFARPFVLDSSAFQNTFGVAPTPAGEALSATVAWWRERAAAAA